MGASGAPGLILFDWDDKANALLYIASDGTPSLAITDKERKERAVFGLQADGSPSLKLLDRDGKTSRAGLGHVALETTRTGAVEERPASSLVLIDKDAKAIWRAP